MNIEYSKKRYLQQKSEYEFYKELKRVITDDVIILPQVHLERIIQIHCDPQEAHSENYFYHGISELSFDFVLFDKSFEPLLAIELDGTSHNDKKRQERDAFVEEICRQAQLPLLRWKRADAYDPIELKQEIFKHLPHVGK